VSSRWTRGLVAALLLMTAALPVSPRGPLAGRAASGAPVAAGVDRLAHPTDPNDGVAWTNYLRAFGENLPPITTSPELSAPPQRHASWLAAFHAAGDPYCAHGQDATHTWPAGEDHSHNVLYCGPPSLGAAIQGWVDTPYHGAGFVDPTTTAIGFGFAGDTSTGLFAGGGAPALSRWPKPNGVLPSPAMTTGESPEPRTACGYPSGPVGRPIFVSLPAPVVFAASSIVGPGGLVAHCALHANPFEAGAPLLEAGDTTGQIVLLAELPYTRGQIYTATVVTSTVTTTWSFQVGDAPAAPVVTAAPSGAGQLTVSWQAADGHGLPVTSYRVDDVTTGQSQVVAGTQTAATFVGLTIGATHDFRVVATNDLGDGPPGAAAATAIDAPPAPTIVAIVPGPASAFVSWAFTPSATAPVTGFQVELDGGPPLDVGYVTTRTLAALQEGHSYTVRVRATNPAVAGAWSEPRTVTPTTAGRLFHGLPLPMRAVDTRTGGGPLVPGAVLAVPVVATTGVAPRAVAAISMNLTATNATGPGYVTAWPCDQPAPEASSLNYAGGEPGVPNHAIVPVAPDGTVCIATGVHPADVIVDVDGWFSFDAGLQPESPHRALDTRPAGGAIADVAVAVVPAGSRAAVVNLTAAGGSGAAGYVTAYACGTAVPLASNLNFGAGQTVANAAVVPVAADGSLCLHASTPTDLVVDVAGALSDNYVATTPTRLLDTREGGAPVTGVELAATPAGAAGAILNVTAAGGSTADGFVTVYPGGVPQPPTSNVNFRAGQIVPNAVVVHPDGAGHVLVSATTPVHLVVDSFGSFL
jgi:hypothetical protein